MTDESLRALPRDVPDFHARQAAHLRALAANATDETTTGRLPKGPPEQRVRCPRGIPEPGGSLTCP
jgi:hypothetical protein